MNMRLVCPATEKVALFLKYDLFLFSEKVCIYGWLTQPLKESHFLKKECDFF